MGPHSRSPCRRSRRETQTVEEAEPTVAKRVLITDDEKNMRWALDETLSKEGYEVSQAADGKEAMPAIEDNPPDLMVLDHKMPAPDGMEVLRRIRARGETFPVIMLTAHGNVQLAVEGMKAGATEYMPKPFDLEELKLAIEKALRISELSEEVQRLRDELDATGTSTASSPRTLGCSR